MAHKKRIDKFSLDGNFLMRYDSIHEAGTMEGISPKNIQRAAVNEKTAGSFLWRYSSEQFATQRITPLYSERQRMEFEELIKSNRKYIYGILYKFNFVREADKQLQDDYYQEAVLATWTNYFRFKPQEYSFKSFLGVNVRSAVLLFYKKWSYKKTQTTYLDDFWSYPDLMYDTYEDSHIPGLYKAISSLPKEDQLIIQSVLNGDDLIELAVKHGKARNHYKTEAGKIRKYILLNRHRFFDCTNIKVDASKLAVAELVKKVGEKIITKPVRQLTLKGEMVKIWPSVSSTRENGFCPKNVNRAIKNKGRAGGFLWEYAPEAKGLTRSQMAMAIAV